MKNIKYIIISTMIMLMLSACGNDGNVGTNNNGTTNNGDNMIENTGDAVSDVGNGVAEGIKDVGNGVANGVDQMTGNDTK